MSYQELLTNNLDEPWLTLVRKSQFIYNEKSKTGLVVVDERAKMFFQSLDILTKLYPIIKKEYAELRSLLVVSNNLYNSVGDSKPLEIIDII